MPAKHLQPQQQITSLQWGEPGQHTTHARTRVVADAAADESRDKEEDGADDEEVDGGAEAPWRARGKVVPRRRAAAHQSTRVVMRAAGLAHLAEPAMHRETQGACRTWYVPGGDQDDADDEKDVRHAVDELSVAHEALGKEDCEPNNDANAHDNQPAHACDQIHIATSQQTL